MSENVQGGSPWTVAWSTKSADPRVRFSWQIGPAPDRLATKVVDGRLFAVAEPSGDSVRVWDLATGEEGYVPWEDFADVVHETPETLEVGDRTFTMKPPAPLTVDGRALTAACQGLRIEVRDPLTEQQIVEPFVVAPQTPTAVTAAVVDGVYWIIAASGDENSGTLWVWELARREKPGDPVTSHANDVTGLDTVLIDGRRVLVSAGDTTLRLWDPAAGGAVGAPLGGPPGTDPEIVTAGVAMAGVATTVLDGRPHAVAVAADGLAHLWDLAAGRPVGPGLSRYPPAAAVARPINERIMAAFAGVSEHHVFAVATAVVGGSPVAVVGGQDGAQVWDLATGEARGEPLTKDMVMLAATMQLDGRPVAVTNGAPDPIRLWDLETGAQIGELPGDIRTEGPVTALAIAELDGRTVILAARSPAPRGSSIQIWDPATCRLIGEPMTDQEDPQLVGTMTIATLDGRPHIVAGGIIPGGRGKIVTWDPATGEQVGEPLILPLSVAAVIPYPEGPEESLAIAYGLDVAVLTPR